MLFLGQVLGLSLNAHLDCLESFLHWLGSKVAAWAELLVALGILGLCFEHPGLFQNALQLTSLSKLHASWEFLLYGL